MKYFKKLLGETIYLSPRSTEDVEKFTEWLNDFEVTDYLSRSSQLVTLEYERKYLEEPKKDEVSFAIITINESRLIGTVSLMNIDYINRTATLGIFIGDKEYRNNGCGTEAIRLILDYGFNYLNLNNIQLEVLEFNERAIKSYKKCGFKEYGRRRKSKFINGQYYDVIEMDILAEELEDSYIRNKEI